MQFSVIFPALAHCPLMLLSAMEDKGQEYWLSCSGVAKVHGHFLHFDGSWILPLRLSIFLFCIPKFLSQMEVNGDKQQLQIITLIPRRIKIFFNYYDAFLLNDLTCLEDRLVP